MTFYEICSILAFGGRLPKFINNFMIKDRHFRVRIESFVCLLLNSASALIRLLVPRILGSLWLVHSKNVCSTELHTKSHIPHLDLIVPSKDKFNNISITFRCELMKMDFLICIHFCHRRMPCCNCYLDWKRKSDIISRCTSGIWPPSIIFRLPYNVHYAHVPVPSRTWWYSCWYSVAVSVRGSRDTAFFHFHFRWPLGPYLSFPASSFIVQFWHVANHFWRCRLHFPKLKYINSNSFEMTRSRLPHRATAPPMNPGPRRRTPKVKCYAKLCTYVQIS